MTIARLIALLIPGLLFSIEARASDTYLCLTEQTTGFSFDSARKTWKSADFGSAKKIAITRSKAKSYAWDAREVGDSQPGATCENDFNDAGNLFCSGVFELRFNRRQLRFLYVYPIGYWSDGDGKGSAREGENTPAMAIGTCKPL